MQRIGAAISPALVPFADSVIKAALGTAITAGMQSQHACLQLHLRSLLISWQLLHDTSTYRVCMCHTSGNCHLWSARWTLPALLVCITYLLFAHVYSFSLSRLSWDKGLPCNLS